MLGAQPRERRGRDRRGRARRDRRTARRARARAAGPRSRPRARRGAPAPPLSSSTRRGPISCGSNPTSASDCHATAGRRRRTPRSPRRAPSGAGAAAARAGTRRRPARRRRAAAALDARVALARIEQARRAPTPASTCPSRCDRRRAPPRRGRSQVDVARARGAPTACARVHVTDVAQHDQRVVTPRCSADDAAGSGLDGGRRRRGHDPCPRRARSCGPRPRPRPRGA